MDINNPISEGVVVEKESAVQTPIEKSGLMETINDIRSYEALLSRAAERKSTEIYPNSGPEHASVAMGVLFKNTHRSIKLIATDFNGDVSNKEPYVSALSSCLEKKINVSIISLKKPKNSRGYQLFVEYKKKHADRISIRMASEITIKYLNDQISDEIKLGELFNLGLFDEDKFRLELLPSKYTALISFNNPKKVTRYDQIFEEAFASANEIV